MDVEMKVSGMKSGESDKNLKETLAGTEGVQHIEIHSDKNIVKITYDQEQVSLETICETIEDQGFTVDR